MSISSMSCSSLQSMIWLMIVPARATTRGRSSSPGGLLNVAHATGIRSRRSFSCESTKPVSVSPGSMPSAQRLPGTANQLLQNHTDDNQRDSQEPAERCSLAHLELHVEDHPGDLD